MIRIAITGPESSGKTTLAEQIASKLNGTLVPEFARNYLLERNGIYSYNDLEVIAIGQVNSCEITLSSNLLVSDTELLVMKIWSEFKFGKCSDSILKLLENQTFDHYFLCRPDIPWEEDPLREHPEQREELYTLYFKELANRELPFTVIEGEQSERLKKCEAVINSLKTTL